MNTNSPFYQRLKAVLLKIYGWLIRVRVFGKERIALPLQTGFIVAANHLTGADSIVIQIGLKTRIFFIAWARWFHSRFVGFWMRNLCDTLPVNKGVHPDNIATLRHSIKLLKQGATIGIYPEGELNRSGQIQRVYDGTAWLAVRAGVPVLPVYVTGLKLGPAPHSRPWLNEAWEGFFSVVGNLLNRNITILIGEPIFPDAPPKNAAELRTQIQRINRQLLTQFRQMELEINNSKQKTASFNPPVDPRRN
jgi:1-acyl-sn-glycerol-3-phosphate acyltransferase